MPAEAELILFGIQAALRINEQFRHAYADSTRARAITLPLPNFPSVPDRSTMENFYRNGNGQEFAVTNLRVRFLLNRLSDTGNLFSEEDQEFARLYQEHRTMILAGRQDMVGVGKNAAGITNEDIIHLVTIRQWREGQDPNPTLLRRMAGTLVNIAVEYFADVPGAISTTTPRGKALRRFLEAFEAIDFATDGRGEILEGLFVATVETLRDHPELVSDDDRIGELVHTMAKNLFEGSKALLAVPNQTLSEKERIRNWAQMVLRSVLTTAGETVFAEPEKFLGISGPGQAELVGRVGESILESILTNADVNLSALFTRESLDRVGKAALTAAGNHPELIGANSTFLKNLIGTTAKELAASSEKLGASFLPEAIRLILKNTAENLELLMPAGPDEPGKHLLIIASREVLKQLAAAPADGAQWKLTFGAAEALHVLEAVIDEVVQNPAWLEKAAGDASTLLGEVTREVLDTLRKIAPPRLSKQTVLAILEAALRGAGKRLEFMEKNPQNRRLIGLAVEAVLTTIFRPETDAKAAWILARDAAVERLVDLVLDKLARLGVSAEKIEKVRQFLAEKIKQLAAGGAWSWDDVSNQLEAQLA